MGSFWVLLVVSHMAVLIHTGNSCKVQIESDQDFVLLGRTAHFNCTSDCPGAQWETRLTKVSTSKTDTFTSVEVLVDDWEESFIKCMVLTHDDRIHKEELPISAYALPSRVAIDLKNELEEDKEHEVTCSVDNVAPVKHVILSLTRGGESLRSRTFKGDTRIGPQNLKETFTFITSRSDNLEDFACKVTLNLTRVTNTTVQSSAVTIRTYALPENPRITAEKWVEQGTVTDISCDVARAFPPDNIVTKLYLEGFPNTTSYGIASASFTLNTSDLSPAQYNVVCESQAFNLSKSSNKLMFIYESPKVNLSMSSNVVTLGNTVTIDCNLIQGNAEYFSLLVNIGEEVMLPSTSLPKEINITKREPELSVTCRALIAENKKELHTDEKLLTVHYQPMFTEDTCPSSIVWVEGKERMFGCRSDGNPTPEEQCSFSNWSLKTSTSFTAERNMSGVYTCQASNSVGSVERAVEVIVQYPPGTPTVNISTSSINAGGAVNLTCHSDGLPPPTYSWEIPPHAQVDFSKDNRSITIREASSNHNGNYVCRVKNDHGHLFERQTLEVKSDNTTLWAALVGVGIFILVVTLIGLASYFLSQNGKKGFYDLVRRIPRNPDNAGVPLQENSNV